jgi:Flp pilus assembly protein TadG
MAPLNFSRRRRLGSERGAELIEMAFVLPLLLLIVVGIVDFGFLFRELSVVTNAAREGARAGVLPEYGADQNVVDRVQQYLDASGVNVTCALGNAGPCRVNAPVQSIASPSGTIQARNVSVVIFHNFSFLGPISALVGGSFTSVPLTGRAVMRLETPAP